MWAYHTIGSHFIFNVAVDYMNHKLTTRVITLYLLWRCFALKNITTRDHSIFNVEVEYPNFTTTASHLTVHSGTLLLSIPREKILLLIMGS